MKIRSNLRVLMEQQGITQSALAAATKLSPETIRKMSVDYPSRVDMKTLTKLLEYFGLNSLSQLIEIEDPA